MPEPIIIIGMHRSGTTMVTRMLQGLGLFVGHDLESNLESRFFIDHNNWLLQQYGASWWNPASFRWSESGDVPKHLVTDFLKIRLGGLPCAGYLGWRRFALGRRLLDPGMERWGWKDPRNTFTLPAWLEFFPRARVVHVYRNGLSVAGSLRARQLRETNERIREYERNKRLGLYNFKRNRIDFVRSLRCLDLLSAFRLWEEYVEAAFARVAELGDRAASFRYEDILAAPETELDRIASFCGFEPSRERLVAAAGEVRPERAVAHEVVRDEEKLRAASIASRWMNELGYLRGS